MERGRLLAQDLMSELDEAQRLLVDKKATFDLVVPVIIAGAFALAGVVISRI